MPDRAGCCAQARPRSCTIPRQKEDSILFDTAASRWSKRICTVVLQGMTVLALAGLAACGSGGGSGPSSASATWIQGVFAPSSSFAAQCAMPRSGSDPYTGRLFPDVQGSTLSENSYLRSWTNELNSRPV